MKTKLLISLLFLSSLPESAVVAVDYTVIHQFVDGSGKRPRRGVVLGKDGRLYGSTQKDSVVFAVNPDGTGYTAIHTFPANEAGFDGLIQASDGRIYSAMFDGINANGRIFRVDSNGGNYQDIVVFNNTLAGLLPRGRLLEASDGKLYGFVSEGTIFGLGGIFRIDPDGMNYQVLVSFSGMGGANPGRLDGINPGKLIEASDGRLYGTTPLGGQFDQGAIFRIDKNGANYTVLRHLDTSDGIYPSSGVFQVANGKLYGTATEGGSTDNGTIFTLNLDGTGFSVLHHFDGFDGYHPNGGLIRGSDGRLYGNCFRGGDPNDANSNQGIVFRIKPDGSAFSVIHRFFQGIGVQPDGPLVETSPGVFYGTSAFGPSMGAIYRLDAAQRRPVVKPRGRKRVKTLRRRIRIRGIARDDVEIENVFWRGRRGKIELAKGTRTWRFTARLKQRRTVIRVFAEDFDDNQSRKARVVVTRR